MLNNGFLRIIKTRPGYLICDKCKGNGEVEIHSVFTSQNTTTIQCPKCGGNGEVDWITHIVGKPYLVNLKLETKQLVKRKRQLKGD